MIQRFDELIATVWMAEKNSAATPVIARFGFDLISVNRRQRQKKNIASRYESVGIPSAFGSPFRHRNAIRVSCTDRQFVQQVTSSTLCARAPVLATPVRARHQSLRGADHNQAANAATLHHTDAALAPDEVVES